VGAVTGWGDIAGLRQNRDKTLQAGVFAARGLALGLQPGATTVGKAFAEMLKPKPCQGLRSVVMNTSDARSTCVRIAPRGYFSAQNRHLHWEPLCSSHAPIASGSQPGSLV
jgi:hypothetical protein